MKLMASLANVAKAEPYLATKTQSSTNVQVELLDAIVDLFQTVSLEDKIKLCFVVGECSWLARHKT